MVTRLSRRAFSGGVLALAAASGWPGSGRSTTERAPNRPRLPFDASESLSIAFLESHWELIKELIEAYADDLGIEIDPNPYGYDELYGQLNLALTQQSSTFDIVSLEDPWIPQFASFLTPLELDSDLQDAFVPIARSLGAFPSDAPLCASPWLGEVQFFAARPTWLDDAHLSQPSTWDDTLETSTSLAATLEPDSERFAFAISTTTAHDAVQSFLPVLWGHGKAILDPDSNIPQLDTPEALAAMDTFLALAALSPEESNATGEPSTVERFQRGEVAMMSNFWSSGLLASSSIEQPPEAGSISATSQPAQSGIAHQTMTGVWLLAIPLGSAYPEAAADFLNWMAGTEFQRDLPGLGLPPARTDLFTDPELNRLQPDLPVLLELLESASPRPRSPFYPQLEQLLAIELDRALSGDQTGAQALKNANVAIREFLVREGVLAV